VYRGGAYDSAALGRIGTTPPQSGQQRQPNDCGGTRCGRVRICPLADGHDGAWPSRSIENMPQITSKHARKTHKLRHQTATAAATTWPTEWDYPCHIIVMQGGGQHVAAGQHSLGRRLSASTAPRLYERSCDSDWKRFRSTRWIFGFFVVQDRYSILSRSMRSTRSSTAAGGADGPAAA
jgi:hypothetical protein